MFLFYNKIFMKLNIIDNELRIQKTNLITDKIKNKMINFMQTTNSISNKQQLDFPVKSRCIDNFNKFKT